jgi:putative addiction module component (TIGR02574 family)
VNAPSAHDQRSGQALAARPGRPYHGVMSVAEKILLEALALPPDARTAVVAELIESLDSTDAVDTEWLVELRRRATAVQSGTSIGTPADVVHTRIRDKLAQG